MKCFDMFETAMRVEAGFRFTKLTDGHKLSLFKELLKLGSNLEPEMSTSQLEMDIQMPRRFKASVLEALEHLYTTDPAGKYTGNDECEFLECSVDFFEVLFSLTPILHPHSPNNTPNLNTSGKINLLQAHHLWPVRIP